MFHRPKQEEENQQQTHAPVQQTAAPVEAVTIEVRGETRGETPAPAAVDYNKVLPGLAESQPTKRIFESKFETSKYETKNEAVNPAYKKPAPEAKPMNSSDDFQDRNNERTTFPPAPMPMSQKPRPFAPSYPGALSSPYGAAEPAADMRRLVIGRGITMSGEIKSCDHLIVEGSVEAALKGANMLEIAETGTFYGTVEIEQATIAGRFEGDLVVSGRLTVRSTGSVTGTIVYKELAIEAGATVDGKINPISGSSIGSKKKETKTKNVAPRNDNSGETSGHELPFGGAAVG